MLNAMVVRICLSKENIMTALEKNSLCSKAHFSYRLLLEGFIWRICGRIPETVLKTTYKIVLEINYEFSNIFFKIFSCGNCIHLNSICVTSASHSCVLY